MAFCSQQIPLSIPGWLVFLLAGASTRHSPEIGAAGPLEDPDHLLMKQVREGDGDAFRRLFDKWKLPLVGFFYRSTGDYHRAEDLAMEVAQKVYRNREKYQPRARFSTWLFQIARNCLRDSWRRKAPVAGAGEPLHGPEWHYPQAVDAEDPQTVLEWEEWLRHALTTFPETERTALLLVVQQEMKPSEAAEVLEVTPNHLRVILNRARNRLKKIREDPL